MAVAEVVTLYESNAMDPKAMAQLLATQIAAGEYGEVRSVAAVLERADGSVEVFGWGETGLLRSLGLLHLGMQKLTKFRFGGA